MMKIRDFKILILRALKGHFTSLESKKAIFFATFWAVVRTHKMNTYHVQIIKDIQRVAFGFCIPKGCNGCGSSVQNQTRCVF